MTATEFKASRVLAAFFLLVIAVFLTVMLFGCQASTQTQPAQTEASRETFEDKGGEEWEVIVTLPRKAKPSNSNNEVLGTVKVEEPEKSESQEGRP